MSLSVGSKPKPALTKIRNLLNTPKFCTICYETTVPLLNLDECPLLEELNDENILNLRQMLEEIFDNAYSKIILSNYVCSNCQLKLVYSYTFIQTTRNRSKNFEYYLTQLDSETIDLLNCMQDNSSFANAVIVIEEHHSKSNKVDNKFTWSSNIIPVKEKVSITDRTTSHVITKNYSCEYCNKEFCDKKFLKAHLNTCGLCETMTDNRLISENGSIPCPKCVKRPCKHEKFIKNFMEQKSRKCSRLICLECTFTSNTLKPLIEHVDKKHMDELADNCEVCGKIFYMREQYFSHFETFHPDCKVCTHCNSVIPIESIEAHEIECVFTEKIYNCDKCPSKFDNEFHATIHALRHDDIPPTREPTSKKKIVLKRSYACPLCQKTFNGKLKLQKHCNNTHGVESYRNNHCQFCDIKFDTRNEYLLHMREMQHMAGIDPNHSYRHKCEYCNYSARYSFILKTHMNRYHLKVMPFQCDICKKQFLDKRKLKAHIDRHMGVGKRVCSICGDTLGSTTALVKHTRLHTGERPYPCHLCDVSLNSASERKFHVLRKHTEKTHPCPLCDTKFHTPYFVRRHIQQVHWKRKEKFDHTKLEGLKPEHYELFRDRRMVVL